MKHAVTSTSNGWTFTYDASGNMTQRNTGTVLDMSYDAEKRRDSAIVAFRGTTGFSAAA